MKKIIPILFIFFVVYGLMNKQEIRIPSYAIRFRIIANSNTIEDQNIKMTIKQDVEQELNKLMVNAKTKEEAMDILKDHLSTIDSLVDKYGVIHTISLGENYFPEKEYKGVKYPSGNYDSLVITLGKGEGDNWWCVMFPPLCLLEAKENNTDEVEYKFYIQEILEKYLR